MNEPKTGELWKHKTSGDHYIVKSTYSFSFKTNRKPLIIVKTLRLRDQYEIDEPLGMFLWEWERLN